jgi:hypothetical protein
MRLRSPIKQRGAIAERWERWHQRSRMAVMHRAQFSCEACGQRMRPLEWHHLVGRNNKGVGEPFCSTPELTVGLCSSGYGQIGCHQGIENGVYNGLRDSLRIDGLARLCASYGLEIPVLEDPLDGIREAVRRLEDVYGYDSATNSIVRME